MLSNQFGIPGTTDERSNFRMCELTQATLSIIMCGLSWVFEVVPDMSKSIMTGFSTLLITAIASAFVFFSTQATLSPTVR